MQQLIDETEEWVSRHWHLDMTLREWWQLLGSCGLAFPSWPDGLGGRGLDRADAAAVARVLAARGVIGAPTGLAVDMGVPTVLAHGTPAQQQRFVPAVVDGSVAWCQLFSEPGAGSDLASAATRAERDGDELVVSGQKVWNSGADTADWGMLLARTDPSVPKRDGLSWMLVDMRQPGIEVRPLVQMNGSAEFCEVFLTEARVPVDHVVGGLGNGWSVARTTLTAERASIGRRSPRGLVDVRGGAMRGQLDRSVGAVIEAVRRARADPSKRFDVMVGHRSMVRLAHDAGRAGDRVVRDRVADYWIRSEVHQLNARRTADNARSGRTGPEGSIGKLSLALLAQRSRELSLSILGAEGMLVGDDARDHGRVQRAALSAHAPALGGGTNEIQRNILGERVLGLPREPEPDDDVPFERRTAR